MLCSLLLSLSLASAPQGASTFHCLDRSFCCEAESDSSGLSESEVASLTVGSAGYKTSLLQFDRDYLPTLCSKRDPRFASLLLGLLKDLDGYRHQLCCAPYILAQVRLREPDREKAAALLISDIKQVCTEETWLGCGSSPIAVSSLIGLRAIAKEGNVAVFRKLLGSDGITRVVALDALGIFYPRTSGHVPPPKAMRALLPDVAGFYGVESDLVQSLAIRVTAGLASDKRELDDYLSKYSRAQPSPGERAQRTLNSVHRYKNKYTDQMKE